MCVHVFAYVQCVHVFAYVQCVHVFAYVPMSMSMSANVYVSVSAYMCVVCESVYAHI